MAYPRCEACGKATATEAECAHIWLPDAARCKCGPGWFSRWRNRKRSAVTWHWIRGIVRIPLEVCLLWIAWYHVHWSVWVLLVGGVATWELLFWLLAVLVQLERDGRL